MIEAGAKEIPDEIMFEGIMAAHEDQQDHRRPHQQDGRRRSASPSSTYEHADFNQELFDKIVEATMDEAKAAMDTDDKNVREERWNKLIDHWHELFLDDYPDMDKYLEELHLQVPEEDRQGMAAGGPPCGRPRQSNEIRPLAAEVGVLPRVHGSGLFTRGQTQVLSASPP